MKVCYVVNFFLCNIKKVKNSKRKLKFMLGLFSICSVEYGKVVVDNKVYFYFW